MGISKSIDGVSVFNGVIGNSKKAGAGTNTMNVISRWVGALALMVAPIAANAQTVSYATVTYAFTAVVTSSDFWTLPIGAYVTGTYTFNYNSADQIIGSHGLVPPGVILFGAGIGGFAIGSTGVPYNPVFSSTVRIGAFTYS